MSGAGLAHSTCSHIINQDISAKRLEYYFRPPLLIECWLSKSIKDQRDLPLAYLIFNVFIITIPAALIVFICESNIVGFLYWLANAALFQERFLLGFHYYSHRGLFRNTTVDFIIPLLLSPFFGVPSGMYYLHHVIMHHVENNSRSWDLSSTEMFQRDNIGHFICYWLRFLFLIWFELPFYAFKRQRYILATGVTAAIFFFWWAMNVLYQIHPHGTFWVFLFPTCVNSLLLMLGNWSQHIFVNPNNPRSNYHLTYNVINDQCNQRTFNDGYHTEHHLNSRRHWSELPANFMANLGKYTEEDAIVFHNIDPIKIGVLVFCGKYDVLAQHLVQLRSPPRSAEEVEKFLRAHLVPISCTQNPDKT